MAEDFDGEPDQKLKRHSCCLFQRSPASHFRLPVSTCAFLRDGRVFSITASI
jgi:hypothetical protein